MEESRSVNASRDVNIRRRRRPQMHYEVCLASSRDGVPPGEVNAYCSMDEEEREAMLLDSFLRILREPLERQQMPSGPSPRSEVT